MRDAKRVQQLLRQLIQLPDEQGETIVSILILLPHVTDLVELRVWHRLERALDRADAGEDVARQIKDIHTYLKSHVPSMHRA